MTKDQLIETLEVMRDKLVEQGEVSQGVTRGDNPVPVCLYRGYSGRKCAIGHVLADEDYKEYMEGKSFHKLFDNGMTKINGYEVSELNARFFREAQNIHDRFLGIDISRIGFQEKMETRFNDLITVCKDTYND